MSSQSSPAVMLRALVMLVCVVAIPLAAVCGKSMPDIFRALRNGRWFAASEANSTPARPVLSQPGKIPQPSDPNVFAAAYDSPLSRPPSNGPAVDTLAHLLPPQAGQNQHRHQNIPDTRVTATADQFTYIQDRLRQLGATEYRLELWGDRRRLHRFTCRIAIGGDPDYTRHFEAIGPDRLGTMHQVLQQVESWRLGVRATTPISVKPFADRNSMNSQH